MNTMSTETTEKAKITFNGTMLEDGGFPTEGYLEYIRGFNPHTHDIQNFMKTLFKAWTYGYLEYCQKKDFLILADGDWRHEVKEGVLILSTGGWSGNEAIIDALSGSLFGLLYWKSSHPDGRHKYYVDMFPE